MTKRIKCHATATRIHGANDGVIQVTFDHIPTMLDLLRLKGCDQIILEDSDHKLIELEKP